MSYVQGAAYGALDSTVVVSFPAPVTPGNLIVVAVNDSPADVAVTSVTDTAGNTYHQAGAIQRGTGDNCDLWYAWNVATATPTTITVTIANRSFPSVCIQEWSGVHAASDPLDAETGAAGDSSGAGHDFAIGPLTPTDSASLVVVAINNFAQDAIPAPLETPGVGFGYDYLYGGALASASPYTAVFSFTSAYYHVAKMAIFRAPFERWVDIPNWHAHARIDASQYPGGQARCLCDLWTEDTGSPLPTIQARLVSLLADGSVDAVVGTSAVLQAATPTDATFPVTLVGHKAHKLQLTSDTADIDLFCAPGAKVTA